MAPQSSRSATGRAFLPFTYSAEIISAWLFFEEEPHA
jgi:hypothetical protein